MIRRLVNNVKITIYIVLAKWHWNRMAHYQSLLNAEQVKSAIQQMRENLGDSI